VLDLCRRADENWPNRSSWRKEASNEGRVLAVRAAEDRLAEPAVLTRNGGRVLVLHAAVPRRTG